MNLAGIDVSATNRFSEIARYANADYKSQSTVDVALELLKTISEVLDIRQVFPRVSEIAQHVLPHDHLQLVSIDPATGQGISQAGSTGSLPEFRSAALGGEDDVRIVGDLRTERVPAARSDDGDLHGRIVAAGYRSLLSIRSVARRPFTASS